MKRLVACLWDETRFRPGRLSFRGGQGRDSTHWVACATRNRQRVQVAQTVPASSHGSRWKRLTVASESNAKSQSHRRYIYAILMLRLRVSVRVRAGVQCGRWCACVCECAHVCVPARARARVPCECARAWPCVCVCVCVRRGGVHACGAWGWGGWEERRVTRSGPTRQTLAGGPARRQRTRSARATWRVTRCR